MVGSSQSVATPSAVLNTAIADVLARFADKLEVAAKKGSDMAAAERELIAESYKAHRRVVFNGNGYAEEWHREAARRGLPSFKSAVEVIPEFASQSGVELFARHGVFTKEEAESRCVIYLEKYAKQVNIEAGIMVEMARRYIFPAITASAEDYARAASSLAAVGAQSSPQELRARKIAEFASAIFEETDKLEKALAGVQEVEEPLAEARAYRESVIPRMVALREKVDAVEKLVEASRWPFPTYQDLLFSL
jgi:glutamine synthetase